jgi:hypothetical protein
MTTTSLEREANIQAANLLLSLAEVIMAKTNCNLTPSFSLAYIHDKPTFYVEFGAGYSETSWADEHIDEFHTHLKNVAYVLGLQVAIVAEIISPDKIIIQG